MLAKAPSKDTETEIKALIKHAHNIPRTLYKSLSWDRGSEMADHQKFSLATAITVYFCDPKNSWQRESNENTPGCCASTSPKEWICRTFISTDSTLLRYSLTSALEER